MYSFCIELKKFINKTPEVGAKPLPLPLNSPKSGAGSPLSLSHPPTMIPLTVAPIHSSHGNSLKVLRFNGRKQIWPVISAAVNISELHHADCYSEFIKTKMGMMKALNTASVSVEFQTPLS